MSCLSVRGNLIAVARNSSVDLFSLSSNVHTTFDLPPHVNTSKTSEEQDFIVDLIISPDGSLMAVMTGPSKRLLVYEISNLKSYHVFILPRAASRARFTPDSLRILVADKTGDALLYDVKDPASKELKLFGHLSVLLDILMTEDCNYIITSDRDEKIRVSHYPNTYNIKSYCLGHKEFVKQIELLPNDGKFLLSASGDGTVKIWEYADGRLCHTIETDKHIEDGEHLNSYIELMDKDGVEVDTLPIVHMSVMKYDEMSSLIAVCLLNYNRIFVFKLIIKDKQFEHKLTHTLPLEQNPAALKFNDGKLYICFDDEITVHVFMSPNSNNDSFSLLSVCSMFTGEKTTAPKNQIDINLLYKRKFDNVQEYQERKRQRLEKH